MATRAWVNSPLSDGSQVTDVDNKTNEDRQNVRERFVQGGHIMTDVTLASTTENNDGRHTIGIGDALGAAGIFSIYAADGIAKAFTLHGPSHANANQILAEGAYVFTGANVTTGTDPGHKHTVRRTLMFPIIGSPFVAAAGLPLLFQVNFAGTIKEIYLAAGTKPSSGTLLSDIWRDNAAIPTNSNSIFATATNPQLTSASNFDTVAVFDTDEEVVVAGDVFKAEVETVGSSEKDIMIFVDIEATSG